jgi:hypothetical protein
MTLSLLFFHTINTSNAIGEDYPNSIGSKAPSSFIGSSTKSIPFSSCYNSGYSACLRSEMSTPSLKEIGIIIPLLKQPKLGLKSVIY